jgi:hypothetical protein
MEGKKKFEKPELQVVEMKRNLLDTQSSCGGSWCGGRDIGTA